MDALADARSFVAVLVTTPEELAITEVLSLREQVIAAGVAASHVVVNGIWPAYVSMADGLRIAASTVSPDAAMHWRRHRRQRRLAAALEDTIGACARIGFSFSSGTDDLAAAHADMTTLLAGLEMEAP